jgi:flagellin
MGDDKPFHVKKRQKHLGKTQRQRKHAMVQITVSTNVASLTSNRYLNKNVSDTSQSISRLSSGLRIVQASDDAAGLAISNKLRSDEGALDQAIRNASQGASTLQVANGALDQISQILLRLKVLATQVVNGTLGTNERQIVQQEVSQLVEQVDATVDQTNWNGINLFDGGDRGISPRNPFAADSNATTTALNTLAGTLFNNTNIAPTVDGFVDGPVHDVRSTWSSSPGTLDIEVDIGSQTFAASITTDLNKPATITLVSTTNAANHIQLTINGSAANPIIDISTDQSGTVQTQLRAIFGVGSGTNVVFDASSVPAGYSTAAAGTYFSATPITNSLTRGRVEGTVSDVRVQDIGSTGLLQVTVDVGNQTFQGIVANNASSGSVILLTSTKNPQNSFQINTNANFPPVTAAALQSDLDTVFNLTATATNPPVNFTAKRMGEDTIINRLNTASTATSINDVIQATGSAEVGTYTLTSRYDSTNNKTTLYLEHEDGTLFTRDLDDLDQVWSGTKDEYNISFTNGLVLKMNKEAVARLQDGVDPNGLTGIPLPGADLDALVFTIDPGDVTTMDFQVGIEANDLITVKFVSMNTENLGIQGLNVETVDGGKDASKAIDGAIERVGKAQAELGAIQSRMGFVIQNAQITLENTKASRATFTDVDFGAEVTIFTSKQTLSQAAASMSAQANRIPELFLQMLQG